MLAKANYAADKAAAYAEVFETSLPKQLGYLTAGLISVDGKRFAGDYAMAAVLDIAVRLEPTCLDTFPVLKTFYETVIATSAFDGIRDYNMYLQRPSSPITLYYW